MSTVRVLLVAEIEVEDEGFASHDIEKAIGRLNELRGRSGLRDVAAAEHAELRAMFLPRIQAEPLRRPDGAVLPLYYSGPRKE